MRWTALLLSALLSSFGVADVSTRVLGIIHTKPVLFADYIKTLPRVSSRKGNIDGDILILQYHGFHPSEKKYDRSYANFWDDLEKVYKLGMRPVTMTEYVENRMLVAPGATPVVITFDDANATQFRLLKNGSVDPQCGVGIMLKFWALHPDFPPKATFYVCPSMMFGQPRLVDKKIEMLYAWGSEIGNHTMHHPNLGRLSQAQAIKEIGSTSAYLEKKGITSNVHFCIPFGIFPRDHKLVESVNYNGRKFVFESNVLCGANPAPAPTSKKFNRYRIPRVLSNEETDGINTWLARAAAGKLNLYVEP